MRRTTSASCYETNYVRNMTKMNKLSFFYCIDLMAFLSKMRHHSPIQDNKDWNIFSRCTILIVHLHHSPIQDNKDWNRSWPRAAAMASMHHSPIQDNKDWNLLQGGGLDQPGGHHSPIQDNKDWNSRYMTPKTSRSCWHHSPIQDNKDWNQGAATGSTVRSRASFPNPRQQGLKLV